MNYQHISVLRDEAVDLLNCKVGGIFVDGTIGGGGHAMEILKRISPDGMLVGIDLDGSAVRASEERLKQFGAKKKIIKGNFADIDNILDGLHLENVDGILVDVGVSSHQLEETQRGFSFMREAILDMRMADDAKLNAFDIVNDYSESELSLIIKEYGEERMAKKIAKSICLQRAIAPIRTTTELATLIARIYPQRMHARGIHPATKTFQAIRIAVNDELENLKTFLAKVTSRINKGGRLAIISFHSLEDRIVKQAFVEMASSCICPRNIPICGCGKQATIKIITKKPIVASAQEVENNFSSRSAKLRVAERI